MVGGMFLFTNNSRRATWWNSWGCLLFSTVWRGQELYRDASSHNMSGAIHEASQVAQWNPLPMQETQRCMRHRFDPWLRKIPWRREWLPTPGFLPGEFHGQRSLMGYRPWGHKELDITEQLNWTECFMISNSRYHQNKSLSLIFVRYIIKKCMVLQS